MRALCLLVLLWTGPALALTPEGKEFLEISKQLEPVQCQKRQLRRSIALAEAEKRDANARELRSRFAKLNRDPQTSKLEKRLGELESCILDSKGVAHDPEDLQAISFQQRQAFYRCD